MQCTRKMIIIVGMNKVHILWTNKDQIVAKDDESRECRSEPTKTRRLSRSTPPSLSSAHVTHLATQIMEIDESEKEGTFGAKKKEVFPQTATYLIWIICV